MSAPAPEPGRETCVITGASGYVGGRIKTLLEASGWQVRAWSRQAAAPDRRYRLGDTPGPDNWRGIHALVHCAYDFAPRSWSDIQQTNVRGSERLLQSAQAAGVRKVVFISSISAFDGCRSLYGRAKLAIETRAQNLGASIIRPGLVYGPRPGGVFGRIVAKVRAGRLTPLVTGGAQTQYLVHDEDLGSAVGLALTDALDKSYGPITLAHSQGWKLREIVECLGRVIGRSPIFLPVPWQVVWLGLKSLESIGLRPDFRSDSLTGMVYQNPNPDFEPAQRLGLKCRRFEASKDLFEVGQG